MNEQNIVANESNEVKAYTKEPINENNIDDIKKETLCIFNID